MTVSDGTLTDDDTFTLTVSATNQDPTFNQDLGDQSDAEGALISLSAAATDADLDPLTYEATGLPAGLAIDAATGLISGTIDYAAAALSPYAVTITVRDGPSVDDTDTFSWTVTNTNQPPVFIDRHHRPDQCRGRRGEPRCRRHRRRRPDADLLGHRAARLA